MPTELGKAGGLDERSVAVLARVGHEMRQSLSAAPAAIAVIRNDEDPRRRACACHVVERQCARLSRLLDDLIVIARLGSDPTTVRKEPLDLNGVLADLVDAVQSLTARHGQRLELALPPEPFWMVADRVLLEQAFSNVLTNAVKYTNSGGRIWISAAATAADAIVTVGDTGRGIAPDLLPRVFDMFSTESGPAGDGLGIGLAVAKHLVQLHDGSIAIASEGIGCGTRVTVRLPAGRRAIDSPADPAVRSGAHPDCEKLRRHLDSAAGS